MNPSDFPAPLPRFASELGQVEFCTKSSWTAYDLGNVLSSLDAIYCRFLLTRHLALQANALIRRSTEQLDRYLMFLEREGLGLDMPVRDWRRFIHRYSLEAVFINPPYGPLPGMVHEEGLAALSTRELEYYLDNPGEYMPRSHELRVKQIEIKSPGGFTLQGLGEPIRELRELIKDLCYRNRQEREKGDLEILKNKIEIIGGRNLSTQQVQVLAMSAVEDAVEVGGLIKDGQLTLEGEDCGDTAKGANTKKRRSRTRPSNK